MVKNQLPAQSDFYQTEMELVDDGAIAWTGNGGWNMVVVHSEQLDGRMRGPWDGMMVFCDLDGVPYYTEGEALQIW